MPKDDNAVDTIKLGKDLQVGDVIRGENGKCVDGIINAVDIKGDSKFWNKPNYSYYNINDSSHGSMSTSLDLDEKFVIVNSRTEIKKVYNKVELSMLSMSANLLEWRNDLKDIESYAFDRLNKKLKRSE